MPKAVVNGVQLYYEWHGPEGAPALVLVNGVLMTTASWAPQTPALSKSYRVLLYDCRGQGQSDHPAGPYSMQQHAEDLIGLLETLGVGPAHVAGISYGGEIALLLGIQAPRLARSLFISSAVSEVRPQLAAIVESWIAAAKCRDGELLYRCSVTDNFSESWLISHPHLAEQSIPRYQKLDFAAIVALCEAFLGMDCTRDLPKIGLPTMVAVGERDTLKPLDPYARLIAGQIPNAQLLILGGAGHACSVEKPAAWNAALFGFLEQMEE
jgi:3-oxoadipate enol-lactonase